MSSSSAPAPLRRIRAPHGTPHRGALSAEGAALLVVACAGLFGFAAVGGRMEGAIATGTTSRDAPSLGDARGALPAAQAGAASAALDLAKHLPARGSAAYDGYVGTLRSAFAAETGSGMALLDLRAHIPEGFSDRVRAFLGAKETEEGLGSLGASEVSHVLGGYSAWLDQLARDGLRAPDLKPGTFNDRVSWARKSGSLQWHIDGAQRQTGVGAVSALVGPGTRVMPDAPDLRRLFTEFAATKRPSRPDERVTVGITRDVPTAVGAALDRRGFGVEVPEGHVVFLTTADIFGAGTFRGLKPTLHARPHLTGERRLAMIRRYGFDAGSFEHGVPDASAPAARHALEASRAELLDVMEPGIFDAFVLNP